MLLTLMSWDGNQKKKKKKMTKYSKNFQKKKTSITLPKRILYINSKKVEMFSPS